MIIKKGADSIHFVSLASLPARSTLGYKRGILIVKYFTPQQIMQIEQSSGDKTVFSHIERQTDALADYTAHLLRHHGYNSFAQSEDNILDAGNYDFETKTTPLPHKTIGLIAGLGWIGKNNLLLSKCHGCAMSLSTVLTNAPFIAENAPLQRNKCGNCRICMLICPTKAIYVWWMAVTIL